MNRFDLPSVPRFYGPPSTDHVLPEMSINDTKRERRERREIEKKEGVCDLLVEEVGDGFGP